VKVLVISAHPDDETLGCGGMLLRHRSKGESVHWFVATRCYEPGWDLETIEAKRLEVDCVESACGINPETLVHE